MKNFLKVNWRDLNELGKKTINTSVLFEEGRKNYLDIIKSLDECWGGIDAYNFINNATNYLEYLKADSDYMMELGKFYSSGAKSYNEVIDENSENIKRKTELFEQDKN